MPSALDVRIGGSAKISLSVYNLGYPASVDFGNYFGDFFENEAGKLENGALILENGSVTAGIGCGDFTFSARCEGTGGLSVEQGKQELFFGFIDGKLVVKLCGSVLAEAVCAKAERLQLEKTGGRYSAVYTKDGKTWTYLIRRIPWQLFRV